MLLKEEARFHVPTTNWIACEAPVRLPRKRLADSLVF